VVACGALSLSVSRVCAARGWPVHVHPLPPLLHNRPDRIAAAVRRAVLDLGPRYARVAVAYADCGSYGALDEVCADLAVPRLPGAHCYDVLAGEQRVRDLLADEPGSYLLTDFLAASFHRSVVVELGLDRYPDLRDDYFRHYTRVVWLTERPTDSLRAAAQAAADLLDLPLHELPVGHHGLEAALEALLTPGTGAPRSE
jgi:hypothetical protein